MELEMEMERWIWILIWGQDKANSPRNQEKEPKWPCN